MRIYARLRPGNPPQLEKAQTLFQEKFFDENRYRLGRVGRFRINRKFDQNVPETRDDAPQRGPGQRAEVHVQAAQRRRLRRRHRPPGQPPPPHDRRAGRRGAPQGLPEAQAHRPGAHEPQGPERAGPHRRAGEHQEHQQLDRLLLRPRRAVAGRRPDQPAQPAHARAAPVGPRARRLEPQARRLRGARRAHLALRPHLPDRDAGRHQHRPDRVAVDLRRPRRVRLPDHAVPRGARTARSTASTSTCAPTRR